jgi:hypothetical protein
MDRGRKKRTNIRKHVVKNAATDAHTMRRRILLTGGSGVLSTTAAVCFAGAPGREGAGVFAVVADDRF